MNKEDIIRMAREAGFLSEYRGEIQTPYIEEADISKLLERFAKLAAAAEREACAKVVEAHQIPVGNSPAGEMACEWTYEALKEIRDAIRARGQQ